MTVKTPDTKRTSNGRSPNGVATRDTLLDRIDSRVDERFDGEATRSSLAILLSAFAVVMAAVASLCDRPPAPSIADP